MQAQAIQRQYDSVIAEHYDQDPQETTGKSLDRAISQLRGAGLLEGGLPPMRVLDLGMGTGMFLTRLRTESQREIEPYGLDVSAEMLRLASEKHPDLQWEVDDAANLERHFEGVRFDLICTHFVTGFVPIDQLAPGIFERLAPGGHWSFVGGTASGYPELRRRASSPLLRLLFGGRRTELGGLICPDDEQQIRQEMLRQEFAIRKAEMFEPQLEFPGYDSFMEYAYHGGWLTPFIEEIGLHEARPTVIRLLNAFVFPITDHHQIYLALAAKPGPAD